MSNLLDEIRKQQNITTTVNGAKCLKTSTNSLLDFFANGGSMRNATDEQIISLFIKAFKEDSSLALKTLFWIRDVRGGCGERRIFKVIIEYLGKYHSEKLIPLIQHIPTYGRWDDILPLIQCKNKAVSKEVFITIDKQLEKDLNNIKNNESVSLIGKWLPSSSSKKKENRIYASILRNEYGLTKKSYNTLLKILRANIGIIETKLTENRYNDIDYATQCSKALYKYRMAFIRNDNDRYVEYIEGVNSGEKKMNTGTLLPHEIVMPLLSRYRHISDSEAETIKATWANQVDYVQGNTEDTLVMADMSGSMTCNDGLPMAVSMSLAMYFAERNHGAFKDSFISYSSNPTLIDLDGDLLENVAKIRNEDNLSTDVEKAFNLLLSTAIINKLPQKELPKRILIISDMQFNDMMYHSNRGFRDVDNYDKTLFESMKVKWESAGYEMPLLVFWNVNASDSKVPMKATEFGVHMVSGFSPAIIQAIFKGEFLNPLGLMLSVIDTERYSVIE